MRAPVTTGLIRVALTSPLVLTGTSWPPIGPPPASGAQRWTVDPGTGEVWFEVYSRQTGSGWVLADHLLPA